MNKGYTKVKILEIPRNRKLHSTVVSHQERKLPTLYIINEKVDELGIVLVEVDQKLEIIRDMIMEAHVEKQNAQIDGMTSRYYK